MISRLLLTVAIVVMAMTPVIFLVMGVIRHLRENGGLTMLIIAIAKVLFN